MNASIPKIHENEAHLKLGIKKCENDFVQLIRERLGIIIHDHQMKELHKTLLTACHKFNCTPENYLKMLKECGQDSPVLVHLIVGVTIGETYFFRDKHQMQLLQETLLPELIKNKRESNDLSLRIWSAGAATGEEIYTIAMMLCELLPDIERWTLNLLGTDINTLSLRKALTGIYGEWSMRSITDYYKKRYFIKKENKYILAEKIRDLVTFAYLNLNEDTYPSLFNGTNAQDLILCRNVLIYFDNAVTARLMQKFSLSLVEGGYLLLGASDPITTANTNLIFHHGKGILFSRPMTNAITLEKPISIQTNIQKTITPVSIKKRMVAHVTTKRPTAQLQPKNTQHVQQIQITQFLNEARWQEVLDAVFAYEISEQKSAFTLSAKAIALANLGKLEEAALLCQEGLTLDPTNKQLYFTFALTLLERNKLKEAEIALRKTLFLDHQFVEGHFQLGLLLIKNKQHTAGLKSLRNALAIVATKDPMQAVLGLQGLKYGRLAEILQREIDLYAAKGSISHANLA